MPVSDATGTPGHHGSHVANLSLEMKPLTLLLAGLILAQPAPAQTLAEALEQAWKRYPPASALAARDEEAQARAELAQSLTPGPPALSLGHLNDRIDRRRGKEEWEAELAVPLWLPGQQAARQAEAQSIVAETAARRAALRLQLAGEVREAWWTLAAARSTRELAAQRAATARALADEVQRRHQTGELARLDANLARSESLAAEAEVIEAEAAVQEGEQVWRNLTGSASPRELAEETEGPPNPAAEHPQVAALAATARSARNRMRLAEETRRDAPELALRVVRERGDFSEAYSNTVGIKFTLPFSSGPRVRQESAAARAEADQAESEWAQARQRLELETQQARLKLVAAERQLGAARERRVLAADNLALSEKAFALGESDLATLLRLRAAAYEAQAAFKRHEVARAAARSRLLQVRGILP